ncbi:Unknown protein [Striga hermonthica]|uniref:Uncharacterized protein n=1 Tax=Striga hermonthica TaxID=68872 RepID=A0A9N7R2G3_STRHE|nr:Unknown protein [Striga hermonthica]
MCSYKVPEKAAKLAWIVRSNPMVHWWFRILMMGAFLAVLIFWGFDGLNMENLPKDFVVFHLNNPQISSQPHKDPNFTKPPQLGEPQQANSSQTHVNLDSCFAPSSQNASSSSSEVRSDSTFIVPWVSVELEPNYSSSLLARWLTPGGDHCRDSKTVDIRISKIDGESREIELSTGDVHEFSFQALDDLGSPHCLGGDYFEIDLSGEKWKSRPPIKDLGNGTYTFSLQVHPNFPGEYNLTIILLFRSYEGLKFSPARFAFDRTLRVVPIRFRTSQSLLPGIKKCDKKSDFSRDIWSGRWTRHAKNDSCMIENDGRYRCQVSNFPCQKPWCWGPLGLLESNGWVYSAHCSFGLFSGHEAWDCLAGRWIFWWGDSNHCDTIRNLLNFVLGVHDVAAVPRIFDRNITNPSNQAQTVRFTSIFNGHPNDTGNYQGLNSLINPEYRNLIKGYFSGDVVPDTVIMNSGLHDGVFWPNIRGFVKGADFTAAFWAEVVGGVRERGLVVPEIIYRTTVATGGYARKLAFNPAKMEAFNGVVLDKMRAHGVLDRVVDDFDMTYPWHYDNRCNDGVHYGRAPLKMRWKDGLIGHQYFVDLMLCHVLMNALCVR